jgi:hypothetical protein
MAVRRQTSDRRIIDRRMTTLLSSRPKTRCLPSPDETIPLRQGSVDRRSRGRVRLPHRGGVVVDSIDDRSCSGGPNLPRLDHPVGRIDPADDVEMT